MAGHTAMFGAAEKIRPYIHTYDGSAHEQRAVHNVSTRTSSLFKHKDGTAHYRHSIRHF